ncbi:hypothetical protein MBUL_04451 (plasmid) [Methylobacterium bullatum]|uniref:Uncharacterized protein n=1 Tax=Methylobacterium bullatum TaxID=570505 RepID=A0A679JEX1_9HYPH|nr:hypothetical protein MBUL_04451 [Methylobacterium bullatum]
MKILDHALIYRCDSGMWNAARWHAGYKRWLPVIHLQGVHKPLACGIIREEPLCNYSIINDLLNIEDETLSTIDNFARYPDVDVTCPSPSEGTGMWRTVNWTRGVGRVMGLGPTQLKHVSFFAENFVEMKNTNLSRMESAQATRTRHAGLLRWELDALTVADTLAARAKAA